VKLLAAVLSGLVLASSVLAREPGFSEYRAVQESLSRVHPRMRASWLRERGLDDSYYTTFHRPDSTSGLECIGRWPWGPSWELAGRDTFLYLGSGSGVRILSIADSVHPRMLGQINARSLVNEVAVQDSLLFVACGSWGAQIYSVSNPANPRELSSMDAVIGDLCVQDTFCYTAGDGSFRVYNCANPAQPAQVAAVSDSGDVIAEANGYVYVGHGSSGSGLNVYDARNPHSPTLINALGGAQLALFIRGQLLFRTSVQSSYFQILDISDPTSIHEIGRIDGYGGQALYADDYFAYLSCTYDHEGLFVIDITNPANPQLRDSLNPEGTENYDSHVPAPLSYGYLASMEGGLVTLDMHNVNNLSQVWEGYKADQSVSIAVDNGRAYIANVWVGTQIVDVTDPTRPVSLGVYDTSDSRGTNAVVARDSFAFVGMSGAYGRRSLRVIDVSDPSSPTLVAEESCYSWPQDMVLHDSLLYAAEIDYFVVTNVARPREPVLVGSLSTQDGTYFGLAVRDSLAFLISGMIEVINVAQPANPTIVSRAASFGSGIAVRDTFVYVPYGYDTLRVFSAANPKQLRLLGYAPLQTYTWDVALAESTAVVATFDGLEAFSLEDPAHPHWRAATATPYGPRRVVYSAPYFYTAMWEAGVGIYSAESLGLQEQVAPVLRPAGPRVYPNPVHDRCRISLGAVKSGEVRLRDVAGRVIPMVTVQDRTGQCLPLDLSHLAAGVYFVEMGKDGRVVAKFVRQ
jgi:hypothetical protein